MALNPAELGRIAAAKKRQDAADLAKNTAEQERPRYLKAKENLPGFLNLLDRYVQRQAEAGESCAYIILRGSEYQPRWGPDDPSFGRFISETCGFSGNDNVLRYIIEGIGKHFKAMGFTVSEDIHWISGSGEVCKAVLVLYW